MFQLMSDLHLEFSHQYLPVNAGVDTLVLAGDILTAHGIANTHSKRRRYTEFMHHVSSNWKDVIINAGNHEWYGHRRGPLIPYLRRFYETWDNVHFLENDQVQIGDITYVGGTLWTDFFGGNPLQKQIVAAGMNDYHAAPLTTDLTEKFHHATREYISYVAKNAKKVVAVTHHAPTHKSVPPAYVNDPLNAGYYSNMADFILDHPSIVAWPHGHMHGSCDYMVGHCRVIDNPRGYPHELNPDFSEKLVVEV